MFEEFISWAIDVGLDLDDDDDDDAFDQFMEENDVFDDTFAKTDQVQHGLGENSLGENIALADADGDGTIDKTEFSTLLASSGSMSTDMQASIMFIAADKNGDGELSSDEIHRSTNFRQEPKRNT